MKQDHEELIEAMAEAAYEDARDRWAIKLGSTWADLDEKTKNWHRADARAMIRAANERGFDLCKLPERLGDDYWHEERKFAHNRCLDAVEVVRIGEGDE